MRYAITRVLQIIPMLLVLSVVVFTMMRMIPGDPVRNMLGQEATMDVIVSERARLGLDKPLTTQYFIFMQNLFRGDLGKSITTRNTVVYELQRRYPQTLMLAVGGTVLSAVLGMGLGVIAAVKHNTFWDNAIITLSMISVSTPSFFLAILFMLLFSVTLNWLPTFGLSSARHAIMPILTLGLGAMGLVARTTRSSMLDVLGQDYIRTSRSLGLRERMVIYSHAIKNALIPVVTVIGLRFGGLLAGATLVETVFSISGIGRFLVDGVIKRDYPVVQGAMLVLATSFIIVNTIVDLLYAVINPQIRMNKGGQV